MAKSLGTLFVKLDALTTGFNRQIKGATAALGKMETSMRSLRNATAVGTAALAAVGGAAVRMGSRFEDSITRAGALSRSLGTEGFAQLRDRALELGASTQFSASQVGDAMGFMAQAGLSVSQIYSTIPGVLQLSAAAGTDLAQSADIATNILGGFGLQASKLSKVNDVLINTTTRANVNMVELAESMKVLAPVAKGAGVSIDEASAAVGLLGNVGIKGSLAGNALKRGMVRIIKPTKEVSEGMRALGVNLTDSNGRIKSISEVIRALQPHANRTAEIFQIFGLNAGPAFQALISQGADALEDLTGKVSQAGTAAQIQAAMQSTLSGRFKGLQSRIEAAGIAITDILRPSLIDLIARVQGVVDRFLALDERTKATIVRVGQLASVMLTGLSIFAVTILALQAAGGAYLSFATAVVVSTQAVSRFSKAVAMTSLRALTATVMGGAAAFIAAAGGMGAAALAMGKSFIAAIPAIASAAATMAAVTAGALGLTFIVLSLVELWKFYDVEIKAVMRSFAENARAAFMFVRDVAVDAVSTAVSFWGEAWQTASMFVMDVFGPAFRFIGESVRAAARFIADVVPEAWKRVADFAVETFAGVAKALGEAVKVAAKFWQDTFAGVFDGIIAGIRKVIEWIEVAAEFWGKKLGFLGDLSFPPILANLDINLESLRLPKIERNFEKLNDVVGESVGKYQNVNRALSDLPELPEQADFEGGAAPDTKASDAITTQASNVAGSLGKAGQLFRAAVQGLQAGGPIAALVAALAVLAAMTEGFTRIIGSLDRIVTGLAMAINPITGAVADLLDVVVPILLPIVSELGRVLATAAQSFALLAPILQQLAPAVAIVAETLQIVAQAMRLLGPVLAIFAARFFVALAIVNAVAVPLANALHRLGNAFEAVINAIANVVNSIVGRLQGILRQIPLVGDDLARALGGLRIQVAALAPRVDAAADSAEGLGAAAAAAGDALCGDQAPGADLCESAAAAGAGLTNVPQDFNLAAERFLSGGGGRTATAAETFEGASFSETLQRFVDEFGESMGGAGSAADRMARALDELRPEQVSAMSQFSGATTGLSTNLAALGMSVLDFQTTLVSVTSEAGEAFSPGRSSTGLAGSGFDVEEPDVIPPPVRSDLPSADAFRAGFSGKQTTIENINVKSDNPEAVARAVVDITEWENFASTGGVTVTNGRTLGSASQ